MPKAYYLCPKCHKKGFYVVRGYDPTPKRGPLWRCQYCYFTERRDKDYMVNDDYMAEERPGDSNG